MDLEGSRVVLLGGTSGIGFATAEAAAERGAEVTVVSGNPASVERALAALPTGTRGHAVDLNDPAQVQSLFAGLDLDHLVYTAGEPLALMPVAELDLDRARAFFGLRYFGVLAAVHAAAPHIRAGGSITLTTGTASVRPGPGWSVAASICGAVEALTRTLAVELAPIRVNAVQPGVIRSPLWSGMSEAGREQMYREVGASLPAGRVGEVEDIAAGYLSLMTQPYATGTILTLDGGTLVA
ncbi:SDR family oxidoreductase [Pseudonocardia cypriaca]|uniref:NAD(P)-dependent dehydrogenase (Short-subunit alcohol dehydrogenase family) n=1 Tax=Pseudonocardia cypriaca TaxID=882449 RepID=A0A543FS64_9PSEU|nr:SDR family oxidoreductase [Pseudonocardia cypriaca]TQM36642.1 NAD(P)-dependent dehydrogenase (short-subunit alcohol dehydrogenase family) [Pseudonocardia cypriaca]